MRIYIFLLLFSVSLFASQTCIKNFGKSICSDFKILNSVIIKTSLSKNELKEKINKPITQLAFIENANIFLIDSNTPIEYAKELEKENFIIYAQVNISQMRNKNIQNTNEFLGRYNLKENWKHSKGEGVNIAIIDDGFDLSSEEFSDTNVIFSYDVDTKTLDSSPKLDIDTHGTKVAGIIFAKHNSNEVEGIAPNANFIAIRQTTNITSDSILAFSVAKKAGAHIINCSWNSPILLEPVYDIIKNLSKDTAVVFAAGNEHKKIEPFSTEASIPEVITVGAIQKFSNYGDMVDFNLDSRVISVDKNGNLAMFGGTSATAPIISGLLALKKSLNFDKSMNEIEKDLKREINGR